MAIINEWLSIDRISGTGNAQITLTASSYEELVERTQSLVIQGQRESVYLNVKQNGIVPSITLNTRTLNFEYIGGTKTVTINSNVPWSAIVGEDDWFTVNKTSGEKGATTISVTADRNSLYENKNGIIEFAYEGEVLATLNINLEQKPTPTASLEKTNMDFSYTVDNDTNTITTNSYWKAVCGGEWFSINPTSGNGTTQFTILVTANDSYDAREGKIYFYSDDDILMATLAVSQEGKVRPTATLDYYSISAFGLGGDFVNGITSNVPWTAVVNDNWITIDKTQGESGYTPLSITVDASTETRSGSIIFNAEGVVLTLQIYQIYNLKETYFWIEFEDVGGTISDMDARYVVCEHSFDGITWERTPNTLSMGNNTLVYFRGSWGIRDQYLSIKMNNVKARIGGDISSLTLNDYDIKNKAVCRSMFKDNTNLTDASELILPWTTLETDYWYFGMFEGCTSLTTAPKLPATTLSTFCYGYMFYGCTSLVNAPELPATTLADICYNQMFYGCTSLVNAPELPATTLARSCYSSMFYGCTNLVNAPKLPATTLTDSCYYSMFDGCTSLVNAPALPATTLAEGCYYQMFFGCTSLVNAPKLPATTLTDSCYYSMFCGCTSLVNAPALPATTLAEWCYYQMFDGCTSLVNAPVLPATTLVDDCYEYMFEDCTSLTYIKMLATDISAQSCLYRWVANVSSTGTFVKHPKTDLSTGNSGIPKGWTVKTATE